MPGGTEPGERQVLARASTAQGEIVLRRAGNDFEIISNGVFLMDTRDGRSERLMVTAALDASPAPAPSILIGGLGAGFSLAEAVSHPHLTRIDVVEISPDLIGWHRTHLRHLAEPAWHDDRVIVRNADLVTWLATPRGPYDIVCLDIDNGPEWTVTQANRALYSGAGLRRVCASLRPDGVAAVWSAAAAPVFERRVRQHFAQVGVHQIPVPRGEPDVVYVGSGPRPPGARAGL